MFYPWLQARRNLADHARLLAALPADESDSPDAQEDLPSTAGAPPWGHWDDEQDAMAIDAQVRTGLRVLGGPWRSSGVAPRTWTISSRSRGGCFFVGRLPMKILKARRTHYGHRSLRLHDRHLETLLGDWSIKSGKHQPDALFHERFQNPVKNVAQYSASHRSDGANLAPLSSHAFPSRTCAKRHRTRD